MDLDAVTGLLDASTRRRSRIYDRIIEVVLQQVGQFDGWYSAEAIASLTQQVTAYVEAAQIETAALTNAYLTEVARQVAGSPLGTAPLIDPSALRQGVAHQDVYARLAAHHRWLISRGMDPLDVLAAVQTRAKTLTHMDMQLSVTHQARGWMSYHNWTMYRRVIRPEMSRTGVCGLCLAASDRLYYRGDLLPVHDNCFCTVIPVTRKTDPGSILNRESLDEIYSDARYSTYADDLRKVKYRIEEHGELGPVLVDDAHHFRDAREALALTTH